MVGSGIWVISYTFLINANTRHRSATFRELIDIKKETNTDAGPVNGSGVFLQLSVSGTVEQQPDAHSRFMIALEFAYSPIYEVVISGDPSRSDTQAMLTALRTGFHPGSIVVLRPEGVQAAPVTLRPLFLTADT